MPASNVMPITCPSCHARYQVPESAAGKKITCQKCSKPFLIPQPMQPQWPLMAKLAEKYKFVSNESLREAVAQAMAQSVRAQDIESLFESYLLENALITEAKLSLLRDTRDFYQLQQLDKRFGAMAIERGLVSSEEVSQALTQQTAEFKQTRRLRPIGESLTASGRLEPAQCELLWSAQKRFDLLNSDQDPSLSRPEQDPGQSTGGRPIPITVSKDRLSAVINASEAVSLIAVKEALQDAGIRYGIPPDAVLQERIDTGTAENPSIVVAQGAAAQRGRPAEVTYHFSTDHLKIIAVYRDGRIGQQTSIPFVKAGDLLAEITPGEPGIAGTDVFGETIPAPEPKAANLRCGVGTTCSEDQTHCFAAIDGEPHVSFGGRITVLNSFDVNGDVDLHTGPIDFQGNVKVSGTVREGFQVSCHNLSAREISGAEIHASGDVSVTGGIFNSKVTVRGSVKAKYITGSVLEAFGDVAIQKEIIDSTITNSGRCLIYSGTILSSKISSTQGIYARQVGTEVSSPSRLRAGTDDHLKIEISGIQAVIDQLAADRDQEMTRQQSLVDKDAHIKLEISKLAQVQDRSMINQREIKDALTDSGETLDEQQRGRMERQIEELGKQAREAEQALDALFQRQDELDQQQKAMVDAIARIQAEIDERNDEKAALDRWGREIKTTRVAEVSGNIAAGTILSGVHASIVLKQNYSGVLIREAQRSDTDGEASLEMLISPLR